MRLCIVLILLQSICFLNAGKLPPFTAKEISLMLRTGYSSEAVQKELATRHFVGAIDPSAEKALLLAGATPEFVAALKSGTYAVPPEEIAAVQQELAATEQRRALQAEESRRLNTLYQSKLAQERAAAALMPSNASHAIAGMVKGDLVTSKNGILSVYNDQPLEKKKLIALYFSASWCGPCRKFTPDLVRYYNGVTPAHPEFEIIFVSRDRSSAAMEAYMRDMQMPWPAVVFDKLAGKEGLLKYAGEGIPCLVLIDGTGKVVSSSHDGTTYLGPAKVIGDLDRIFASGSAGAGGITTLMDVRLNPAPRR